MKYNPKIHHRHSIRLRGYDYAEQGWYFLTITTHGKEHVFGEVANWENQLNRYGCAVTECWNELPRHYPLLRLDEFVVMPNHVHGIIELEERVGRVSDPRLRSAPSTYRYKPYGRVSNPPLRTFENGMACLKSSER